MVRGSRNALQRVLQLALLATMACVAAGLTLSSASAAPDPATLVLWHQVGPFSIGESRTRVEYDFGQRVPVGQGVMSSSGYRLHGGYVAVSYDSTNHVGSLTVSTPYYQAANGFRVGFRIPLGICHRTSRACEYRWNGLTFNSRIAIWEGNFVWKGERISVGVLTQRGLVTSFWMAKHGSVGSAHAPSAADKVAIISAVRTTLGSSCPDPLCRFTIIKISASDPSYAYAAIYNPKIGAADLILRRRSGRWRIVAGPGTSQVGCGTVPAQVLNDFGMNC